MGVSREHNGSAPKLYIEFEDTDTDTADEGGGAADGGGGEPAESGETVLVSEREVLGSRPRAGTVSRMTRRTRTLGKLPLRYRKLAAGVVVLAGLAATVSNALVAQASQRQAARAAVTVVNAAYSPSADDLSLNLLVDLADAGSSAVTVTQLEARQSDLSLTYFGTPVILTRTEQLEIVLSGAYDCSADSLNGVAPAAKNSRPGVLHMTMRSVQGNVTTVDVPLPASAQLPDRWQSGRAAYCALLWDN